MTPKRSKSKASKRQTMITEQNSCVLTAEGAEWTQKSRQTTAAAETFHGQREVTLLNEARRIKGTNCTSCSLRTPPFTEWSATLTETKLA